MIQSSGVLVKAPNVLWQGSTRDFPGYNAIGLTGNQWASYSEMYRQQLWVSTVVNKLAMGTARLPLKVYERDDLNRPDASDSPLGRLLRKPNQKHSRFYLWLWVSSTYDIYGEAFLVKMRDSLGTPTQLIPLHPTCMHPEDSSPTGEQTWRFQNGKVRIDGIRQSDLVHFKTYNPDSTLRGMSRLEPLRRSLEFEDAAQRAQSSFWRNGARPGVALTHPSKLSLEAGDRLKMRWDQIATGADRVGTTVVLEEGMKAEVMTIAANEAQYIESRKLHQEEVCGGYDVPPPVVHILDRATFSNITEQMRSMYRDTMAPRLQMFESTLEMELRDSVRPGRSEPDFGDDFYAEFLLDEVLRGDFEARAAAYQQADYMTMAEKRRAENLPYIEGTDRVFVNAATVPLVTDQDAGILTPTDLATALQKIYLAVDKVISAEEAREILNRAGAGLIGPPPEPPAKALPAEVLRSLMGRIGRCKALSDVDSAALVDGYPDHAPVVLTSLAASIDADETIPEFRDRLKAIAGG